MGYYIALEDAQYYEGDTPSFPYQNVPQRENPTDQWINGAWIAGPIPVPKSVTPLQARRALLAANLLDTVTAAVASGPVETQLAWEFANSIDRNSDFTKSLGSALGLSDAQIDELFITASNFT